MRYPAVVVCLIPDPPVWLGITFFVIQTAAFVTAAVGYAAYGRRTLSDMVTKTRVVYRSGR
jgi:hypothetical protein